MRIDTIVLALAHGAHAFVVDGGADRQHTIAAVSGVLQLGPHHLAAVVQHVFDIVRPEIVLAAFGGAARVNVVEHHALRQQFGERLVHFHQPQVAHHLGPKPRVQQMQDGVLNAADVLVHATATAGLVAFAHPILRAFGHHRLRIGRIAIAHEVPARINEGVHGVGFAPRWFAAGGTNHTLVESFVLVQRVARAIGDAVLRQHHRQIFFRHRHRAVFIAMDDGNRRAPITLAAHAPVAQTPGGFLLAQTFGGQQFGHLMNRSFEFQTIECARVHAHAGFGGIPLLPLRGVEH